MFKSLSRTYLTLCVLLVGTCSRVFGIDFSQALSQANDRSLSISSIFEGESSVSNLYTKALKLVKDREVTSTTSSLDNLIDYYSDCPAATQSDFINILYNYNTSFKNTFTQILPKGVKYPTSDEITASYAKFLRCKNGINYNPDTASIDQIQEINTKINNIYYDHYKNFYQLTSIDNINFWSDFFRNGTLDDSDFDLLVDINAIGKLMFEEFKETPEVLFYRLPKIDQASTQAWADLSTLDDQSSYMVGSAWSATSSSPLSLWVSVLLNTNSNSAVLNSNDIGLHTTDSWISQQVSAKKEDPSVSFEWDKEIQDLIQSTTTTTSTIVGSSLVLWNQCLSWIDAETVTVTEQQVQYQTPELYIEDINNFIATASTDDVVMDHLTDVFHKNNPLLSGASTSDSGYASQIAGVYAEKIFGDPQPGSCEYGCQGLSVKEQAQCEVSCVSSCIKQCDDVSGIQNKAICVSDCTCMLIAWPNGLWREKVEDMFRIKFCKVPVQTKTVNPGKKVFSIQAIFQEISDVLQWLRDSGQMTEFSETKEFLDGNIKIKFADNFAFKVLVWFKPVFAQKSAAIAAKEQEKVTTDLNTAILGMNTANPDTDDYNKYIVIADPVKTAAYAEFAETLEDIEENINSFEAVSVAAKNLEASPRIRNTLLYNEQKTQYIDFINTTITFLKENQSFWENMRQVLRDMNATSATLVESIKNSK